jgi:hypothetical protein
MRGACFAQSQLAERSEEIGGTLGEPSAGRWRVLPVVCDSRLALLTLALDEEVIIE